MTQTAALPNDSDAITIAQETFGEGVRSCKRFTTGLRHWVYDVLLDSGRAVVVRLSHPDNRDELRGAVLWTEQLLLVGVPVAPILGCDTEAEQPYILLERLPGTDLGNVFHRLGAVELMGISTEVANMQSLAGTLAPGDGFGYATSYESTLLPSWYSVLEAACARAEAWIEEAEVVEPAWGERVRSRLDAAAGSFGDVEPTAFLHDATTKNVIISDAQVSGLVDVDQMAFGDPLWTSSLTRTALLSAGHTADYVEPQYDALDPTGRHRARFDLYTSLHCLTFLGELGQAFNQAKPAPVDATHRAHLEGMLERLLRE